MADGRGTLARRQEDARRLAQGRAARDAASARARWPWRLLIAAILLTGLAVVWSTNHFLTARSTEATRARAENRAALYIGNLLSELQRTAVVPLLLARDPALA